MSRQRARSIARAALVGVLCPVVAGASIFVGISLVMSFAYLSSGGAPSPDAIHRAGEASAFLQRTGPLLTALYAAAAAFRARERFVDRAIGVGLAATVVGVAVGLAFAEPNWSAGAAVAATIVPLVGAVLGASAAAVREHRVGERARAVAALEAATWRHEVLGVVLGLADALEVRRIALVDASAEPRFLAAWPDRDDGLSAAAIAAMAPRNGSRTARGDGVVVFAGGARGGAGSLLAIELARPGHRLARAETIAAVTADVFLAHGRVSRLERARDADLERERRRVANAVHDTLAQDLTHTVRALEAAQRRLPDADPALFGALESARRGLAGARSLIASGACPATSRVPTSPLATRIRIAVAEAARGLDADVRVRVEGVPAPLDDDAEDLLLRAAREGVNNAKKHARARRIVVTLTYAGDVARLDVRDDGVGFATDVMTAARAPGERVGLQSLRDAARELGASIDLESQPGLGVALAVEVPRPEAARVA